jgi:hypothetical protein
MKIDAVQTIKNNLTMRDILERYGFSAKRRIPCPLHCGKDENFEIKGNNWRCYSHCGSGDTISFVQKLYGLSFQDTLRKIDADFGLNIYGDHSFDELRKSYYEQRALNAIREKERRLKQRAEDEYWVAFDEWKRLDDNRRIYRPKSPDEELHPLFVESLQKMDYQKCVLDCLDKRRTEI